MTLIYGAVQQESEGMLKFDWNIGCELQICSKFGETIVTSQRSL
jgi:hypothetical protein